MVAAAKHGLGNAPHSPVWCQLSLKRTSLQVKASGGIFSFKLKGFKVAIKVPSSFYQGLIEPYESLKKIKPHLFFSNSVGRIHAGMHPSFVHEYMSSLCFPRLVSGFWAWLHSVFNGNAMQEKAMCPGYMYVRNGILVSSSQCNFSLLGCHLVTANKLFENSRM